MREGGDWTPLTKSVALLGEELSSTDIPVLVHMLRPKADSMIDGTKLKYQTPDVSHTCMLSAWFVFSKLQEFQKQTWFKEIAFHDLNHLTCWVYLAAFK